MYDILMGIPVYGFLFFAIGGLNLFGCKYVIKKQYRSLKRRKEFQQNLSLPYLALGIIIIVAGAIYNVSEKSRVATLFCIAAIAAAAVAAVLWIFYVQEEYKNQD